MLQRQKYFALHKLHHNEFVILYLFSTFIASNLYCVS
jgi:hypothetical protein